MQKFLASNLFSSSMVGKPGTDAFGLRSRQELVRDDVSFGPGVDPHRGLMVMIEQLNAARPLVSGEDADERHGVLSAG